MDVVFHPNVYKFDIYLMIIKFDNSVTHALFSTSSVESSSLLKTAIPRDIEVLRPRNHHGWKEESLGFPSVRFSSNLDITSSRYHRFGITSPIGRSRRERSIGPDLIQFGHHHTEVWPTPILRLNSNSYRFSQNKCHIAKFIKLCYCTN